MKIERAKSLKSYNTFGLESRAKLFVRPFYVEELAELLKSEEFKEEKKLVVGSGSNLLFSSHFDGLVIHPAMKSLEILGVEGDSLLVMVGAGVEWDHFVESSVERGWGGAENLSGIPGMVGASPIQNIGAYGAEVCQIVERVEGLYLESGEPFSFGAEECQFGYRDSIFKKELKGKVVITYVTYRLSLKPTVNLEYGDLKRRFEGQSNPSLLEVRDAVTAIRDSKLPDPELLGNAGSFFQNPIIESELAEKIREEWPDVVLYSVEGGSYKIPAGWMIERCGFKGYREGNVGVHEKQALVLVAYEGARGEELIALSEKIKRSVWDRFGVKLLPEVNIL